MDALTLSILSSATYDLLKGGVKLTAQALKGGLKKWLLDENTAQEIVNELEQLDLDDGLSEKAIERKIENSNIPKILESIQPATNITNITQNHSGSGDNVGRDKNC